METLKNTSDLLVVGGGVLGAFHAYAGLMRGLTVNLLERNNAPRGATVRNFGQVVPSGLNLQWQGYGRKSLEIYDAIHQQGDIGIYPNGSLYIASDDEESTLLDELHAINASVGYVSERWSASQCQKRYPNLRSSYCQDGLYFPQEVSANPRLMIHRLHKFLDEQENYQGHFQAGATNIESDGNRVTATTTDGRSFVADQAVVCCGHEFEMLFPSLFRSSDLQAVKLQMLRLRPQMQNQMSGNILTGRTIRRYESFAECPSWNEIKERENEVDFANEFGIHILFKQESDGSIILGDSHEYQPAASSSQMGFDLSNDISEYFITAGKEIFDLEHWDVDSSWYGVYSQTSHPDGIFNQTVDGNIHIATGIGGKGMTSSAGYAMHHLGEIYDD
ncbi:MAG TPA: TIGR03364 family FAD-dependent oxidoreductase [Planctomycetaceae bacterium]|nr:TIGR03364 family FAD-dependent oxidoreductase [Planctomycetaceae bacterium]